MTNPPTPQTGYPPSPLKRLLSRISEPDGASYAVQLLDILGNDIANMRSQLVRRTSDKGTDWWRACTASLQRARGDKAAVLAVTRMLCAKEAKIEAAHKLEITKQQEKTERLRLEVEKQKKINEAKDIEYQINLEASFAARANKAVAEANREAARLQKETQGGSSAEVENLRYALLDETLAKRNMKVARDEAYADLDKIRDHFIQQHGKDAWHRFLIEAGVMRKVKPGNEDSISQDNLELMRQKGLVE